LFASSCRKAGVKVTADCHRHAFATDALANGLPAAQVAEMLGHSGTATLHPDYAHLTAWAKALRVGKGVRNLSWS
jgi:integrase